MYASASHSQALDRTTVFATVDRHLCEAADRAAEADRVGTAASLWAALGALGELHEEPRPAPRPRRKTKLAEAPFDYLCQFAPQELARRADWVAAFERDQAALEALCEHRGWPYGTAPAPLALRRAGWGATCAVFKRAILQDFYRPLLAARANGEAFS